MLELQPECQALLLLPTFGIHHHVLPPNVFDTALNQYRELIAMTSRSATVMDSVVVYHSLKCLNAGHGL